MSDRLSFTTDALPEPDRFAAFCEEIMRRYAAIDIEPRGDDVFRGVIDMQRAGPLAVSKRFSSPADFVRTPKLLGDGNDSVIAVFCRSGSIHQSQLGTALSLEPGEAILMDCGYSGGFHVTTESCFYSVKIPRESITRLRPDLNRLAGLRLDRDETARRLLFGYLDGSLSAALVDGAPATRLYGEHILDLIGLALGAEGDEQQLTEERGLQAARRSAILREIDKCAADPILSAASVAKRLGVTPRYVRLLLEETGRSFSEHLLERRLERVVAMLRNPAKKYCKVADIARDCGFGDLSYFNRAFRRRYGGTPSDARDAAWKNLERVAG
jgi:AraC-like DNA-binding protein